MGTVYLIHFDQPLHHARHYLGYTDNLDERIARHKRGEGARLLQVLLARGIEWEVVRTWEGDRDLERKLKRRKHSDRLCPVCRKEKRINHD
jgi:predicted GIY-YIG superfamily endonuclease